jgi:asparagine synthase (glutamine-hydrolysing)
MCGIAGLLSWSVPPDTAVVAAMTARLAHRGPDAEGVVALGPVVLGHRRLSVIDTAESNNQPLFDQSGELVIAFNGEVYNYRELRRDLEATGAVFRTRGDTEVILEAYRHWGLDCFGRFNGMFAFALWDRPLRRLLLARDRVGEKPLFFSEQPDGRLAFASEPRALRACQDISGEVDLIGLAHYLTLNYTLGEHTLIKGIRSLSPGHYLLVEEGRPRVQKSYWNLAAHFVEKRPFASLGAAAEELRALVDDAVRLRLVADVPLGAFLSGGVDSSAVAAAMAHALPAGQVHTFSLGFGVPTFDEIDAARGVAAHLGLDHKDRIVAADIEQTWPALVAAADEPLADTSAIPTYRLSAFARQFVTVALSGDGADECFAGYETYAADRLHHLLAWVPAPVARGLYTVADRLLPVSFSKVSLDYKIRHFLSELELPFPRAHASWRNIFSAAERREIMQPHWRDLAERPEADPFCQFQPHYAAVAECHYLDRASYADIKTWLADDILVKVDRATMAHSLEARAPLLDHRLVEFAAALPPNWKLKGLRKKHLFKQSQRSRLPNWVLNGQKRGFNAPISQWLSGPLRGFAKDALASERLRDYVRPESVERLWRDQDAGRRDNGLKLYGLVCLSLWLNQL